MALLLMVTADQPKSAAHEQTPGAIDYVIVDADPNLSGIQDCRSVSPGQTFGIDFIVDGINAADSDDFASGGNIGFNFASGDFTSPTIDFTPGAIDDVPGFTAMPQGSTTTKVAGLTHVSRGYLNFEASAPELVGEIVAARATLTTAAASGTLTAIGITKTSPLDGSWDFFLGFSTQVQPTNVESATIAIGVICDEDGDGVADADDLCPATGTGDAVDTNGCSDAQTDSDGDGICDPGAPSGGPSGCTGSDNCPDTPNTSQDNSVHPATPDACEDPDSDLVFDISDNCPDTANPGQENSDVSLEAAGAGVIGDSAGDACDEDDDNESGAETQDPGASGGTCPSGTLPVWADCVETYLGTAIDDNCTGAPGPGGDAFPPDTNTDGNVNMLDVFPMFPVWLQPVQAPPAIDPGRRYDLNADGTLNLMDVFLMFPSWLSSCT